MFEAGLRGAFELMSASTFPFSDTTHTETLEGMHCADLKRARISFSSAVEE